MYNTSMNYEFKDISKIKKAIHSWTSPKLELKNSKISGLGIYAIDEIEEGEILTVWGGKVYTKQEVVEMDDSRAVKWIVSQVSDDFLLGPLTDDTLDWADFYNHSCEPNGTVVNSIFLIANKNIKTDEEITFDYASCNNDFLEMECECGKESCRGYISNKDMKMLEQEGRSTLWPQYKMPKSK